MPAPSAPIRFPAPVAGLNAISPADGLKPFEALRLVNMVGGELGTQTRLGWREWNTGLTGSSDNAVRSLLPFSGARAGGASSALFAATERGIFTCTSSGVIAGPPTIVFSASTNEAGYMISTVLTTTAGGFLIACDEVNGMYRYADSTSLWTKVPAGTTVAWTPNTAYFVGDRVTNAGNIYQCDISGLSAGSGGPTGTGTNIVDNLARWDFVSAVATGAIGPSLADQRAGLTLDPANFVFATVWKSRLWLVERNSTRGWYLEAGAIAGTATSFDFGVKMRQGGALRGLWNWSYDGGGNLDTLLVGISNAGDVVIYQGTDPASASTFGLKGCWDVGAIPRGRRIATDFGGDMLVLSTLGIISLSKLTLGALVEDSSQYQTYQIQPLFNRAVLGAGHISGWQMVLHPTDNTLLVLYPSNTGQEPVQFAMSFATKGWGIYEDLPMRCAAVWNGVLYFGTADGRVCVNDGELDARLLSDPNAFQAINWKVLTGFRNLSGSTHKHAVMARAYLYTGNTIPVAQTTAQYDFDLSEPADPTDSPGGTGWDVDLWDVGLWAGDIPMVSKVSTVVGEGRNVALWLKGRCTARTTLVGVDLYVEEGGLW